VAESNIPFQFAFILIDLNDDLIDLFYSLNWFHIYSFFNFFMSSSGFDIFHPLFFPQMKYDCIYTIINESLIVKNIQ